MRERFEYTKATLEEIGTQPEQSELNPKTELVNMAERSMSLARKDDQMLRGQDKTALEAGYLSELQAFNKEAREKGSVWLEQVESSADSTAEDKIAALRAMSEIHDAVAITSRPPDFEQYEYNPDQALGFEASSDLRVKTAELLDQDGRTEEANKELAKAVNRMIWSSERVTWGRMEKKAANLCIQLKKRLPFETQLKLEGVFWGEDDKGPYGDRDTKQKEEYLKYLAIRHLKRAIEYYDKSIIGMHPTIEQPEDGPEKVKELRELYTEITGQDFDDLDE